MQLRTIIFGAALLTAPGLMYGQFDFHIAGRDVQVHSFASQGFAYSNENNYLSMHTKDGSFSMTDADINIGAQLTDKLHVGSQVYMRKVGKLGDGFKPDLDYYTADYRLKDWLGFRGGKTKTTLGLYNDQQDLTFLFPWALMPQSVYPVDSRGDSIAHIGGDAYGNIDLRHAGSFRYTVWGGQRPSDSGSGLVYGNETSGSVQTPRGVVFVLSSARHLDSYSGPAYGTDLRWSTPLKGFQAGVSYMDMDITLRGSYRSNGAPFTSWTNIDKTYAFYTQYTRGNFEFNGEYRRNVRDNTFLSATGVPGLNPRNSRQGYVSADYRLSKWLQVGAYHSRFILNWQNNHGDPMNHVFDTVVASRFDLTSYLDCKVEGHFIDGTAVNSGMSRGFFVAENPTGIAPQMKMLVIKLEYHL